MTVFYEHDSTVVEVSNNTLTASYFSKGFKGSETYVFYNIDKLSTTVLEKLEKIFVEVEPYVSSFVNANRHQYFIESEHVKLIQILVDNKINLRAGKLFVLQLIVTGYLDNEKYLRSLLENQISVDNTRYSFIEYLFPSFQYLHESKSSLEVKEYSSLDYTKILQQVFFFVGSCSPQKTWGELCNEPIEFKNVSQIHSDAVTSEIKKSLMKYSDLIFHKALKDMTVDVFLRILLRTNNQSLMNIVVEQYFDRIEKQSVEFSNHPNSASYYNYYLNFILSKEEIKRLEKIILQSSRTLNSMYNQIEQDKDEFKTYFFEDYLEFIPYNSLQIVSYLMIEFGDRAAEEFMSVGEHHGWNYNFFEKEDFLLEVIEYFKNGEKSGNLDLYLKISGYLD